MKTIRLGIAAVLLLLAPVITEAFTCNGKIISEGDPMDLVIVRCGQPSSRTVLSQESKGGSYGTTTYSGRGRFNQESTFNATTEQVESLLYNCGEGRLIFSLIFRGGRLQEVVTRGHGEGPRRCD